MDASKVIRIDPLAPLILRSGRPFDGQAGCDPARLPLPSTLAGSLRTAWARANDKAFSPDLFPLSVTGPLLLRGQTLLLPKPADALYFGHGEQTRLLKAMPKPFDPGCGADLPDGLLPVILEEPVAGKPGGGPAWWAMDDWLHFRGDTLADREGLRQRGWSPPAGDRRTHVAIDAKSGAAEEGRLFQTEGMDLAEGLDREGNSSPAIQLLARFDEPLGPSLIHLGGERRLAAIAPHEGKWPSPPPGWLKAISQRGGLSLTLITPGLFTGGYRPGWLDKDLCGSPPGLPELRLRLRAVACERWQPHSGWDLASQQPRTTRKLIPAGAVYWFALLEGAETADLERLWLGSLCDLEQDRRDGFGLALPAAWQLATTN